MKSKSEFSPIRAESISALRVIEYLLFLAVLSSFLREVFRVLSYTFGQTLEAAITRGQNAVTLVVALCFVIVVLRTYVDLQMTDHEGEKEGRTYKFTRLNKGLGGVLERIVRLTIVLIVILAPRSGLSLDYSIANQGVYPLYIGS